MSIVNNVAFFPQERIILVPTNLQISSISQPEMNVSESFSSCHDVRSIIHE